MSSTDILKQFTKFKYCCIEKRIKVKINPQHKLKEYVGRLYISQNKNPQYVIRETTEDDVKE